MIRDSHSRAGGNPATRWTASTHKLWIPACAGMTEVAEVQEKSPAKLPGFFIIRRNGSQRPVFSRRALRRLIFHRRSRFCFVVSFTFMAIPFLSIFRLKAGQTDGQAVRNEPHKVADDLP
ncbi:MAG: hypothetical protein JWP89_118 [Schlesneria sp.]|nr:hypothetical protein [Schlesneria sp.]